MDCSSWQRQWTTYLDPSELLILELSNVAPFPLILQDGSYMKDPLAEACIPCPAGYYCVNDKSLDPERCPHGYYCPQRTGFNWRSCPKGTYDDRGGLANVTCT